MQRAVRLVAILCAVASVGTVRGQVRAPSDPVALARLFDYDGKAPMDVQGQVVAERGGVTIHDITYASPVSGRVPAYLVVPTGPGPFAPILFGHWGEGVRTEFLGEAVRYARAGAVCLLPAYPWVRPAEWRRPVNRFDKPDEDRQTYIQAVVDLRRGIDVLFEQRGVDRTRLGYVGHSYGAQWGAILTAVDRRIKAAVLVAGVPDLDCVFMRDDPDIVAFRTSLPAGQLETYLKAQSVLSAVNYVSRSAPTPLLFQFSAFERNFERDAMERHYAAASQPKRVLWYDTGHEVLDAQAIADRGSFLATQLGLKVKPVS
jgi:hypothetical protein